MTNISINHLNMVLYFFLPGYQFRSAGRLDAGRHSAVTFCEDSAVVFPAPAVGHSADLSGLPGGTQHRQGVFQHHSLLIRIARGSERASEGEPQHQAAGHRKRLISGAVNHQDDCGDTGCFDGPCYQSAGLMADGSSCADDHSVYTVFFEPLGHLRPGDFR